MDYMDSNLQNILLRCGTTMYEWMGHSMWIELIPVGLLV